MNTRMILLGLLLSVSTLAFAQSESATHAEIAKTLNYYLEGGTNNDIETLVKAFHPTATMKYIAKGEYKEVNAIEFFRAGIKPGPPSNRKTRILSVKVQGNAAQAELEIEYDSFYFVDFMNLLKVDGEWKIVSKIFHRKPKAS